MKKNRQPAILKRDLKVYYARAMDGIEPSKIMEDDRQLEVVLSQKGFSITNPYTEQEVQVERADRLVENNIKSLKKSDVVLANLSIQNYTYIGAVFEVVQAANLGIPIVVCVGDSDLVNRYYLHYYSNFICKHISEGVEYIWRCWSLEGTDQQLKEGKEFYDKIATEAGEVTRKPYKDMQSDIDRYERERGLLKEKLRDYCRDKNVLELGCGTGEWTQVIAEVAKSVTCIESSQNMIKRAKGRLKESAIQPDFIHRDFFDETLSVKPCDVIVSYFTLSFLPPFYQNKILPAMKRWISKDGHCLFGESIQISILPSIGLGRQRIQIRRTCGKEYAIYKEHFAPYELEKLLKLNGFKIIDLPIDVTWFTFCAARF
jgi:ubiquinone/menaquinone biosynthesis C-methylase UbiE